MKEIVSYRAMAGNADKRDRQQVGLPLLWREAEVYDVGRQAKFTGG